jgi:hypothetical protein
MANLLRPPHLQLDTSATAFTGRGFIGHIKLSGGSEKTVVTLYDNTSASELILTRYVLGIEEDMESSYSALKVGKRFKKGIYVKFGTPSTGALVIITLS